MDKLIHKYENQNVSISKKRAEYDIFKIFDRGN